MEIDGSPCESRQNSINVDGSRYGSSWKSMEADVIRTQMEVTGNRWKCIQKEMDVGGSTLVRWKQIVEVNGKTSTDFHGSRSISINFYRSKSTSINFHGSKSSCSLFPWKLMEASMEVSLFAFTSCLLPFTSMKDGGNLHGRKQIEWNLVDTYGCYGSGRMSAILVKQVEVYRGIWKLMEASIEYDRRSCN